MRDLELDGQYEQVLGQLVSMSNHPDTMDCRHVQNSPRLRIPRVMKDEDE